MTDDFELVDTEEIPMNNLQIYQQDKAMVDMQIATAKRWPRNLTKCIENAITIVTLDKEVAESCMYTLRKGKTITGPSVHLAKIIAQQMGNMRIENRVVGFDATHVTCEAVCFDLERNFAIRTQIKRSIVGNSGRYSEDMASIVGNAGNAIALRNAIFAVVDAAVVKKIYEAAKKKITGDLTDETKLIARRTSIVNGFKDAYSAYRLTDEEIAASVGKTLIQHIDKDDIVVLIGYEKALKEGEQSFDSIFRPKEKFEAVTAKLKSETKEEDRILLLIEATKDKKSLEKLFPNCTSIKAKTAYDAKLKSFSNV